jgi:hypothetical protein
VPGMLSRAGAFPKKLTEPMAGVLL